ncbi:phosphatases II [Cylindrobasidium torrendii FP15055 ss-10]|uniref:Phosphatases II n=1 Tax=Cylindrobasidium torrendii FP15055 ss-10 TaxID=1314674 RepID=A0A0D7BS71_9AGAR|nr:phosphatases II [Cylindrobasidium torrendii FP15055 ss-10]
MDKIRISKVEGVTCAKAGASQKATVHLTAHHLIFQYESADEEELWVPYPLISLVTRLPQTHQGLSPLSIHLRTFETLSLTFSTDFESLDVFESVKELTVATSVQQLYAFFYTPNPALPNNGWNIYSPREEFGRMGVGTRTKAWRFTDINKDYSFCPTYPARMVVPTRISDTTIQYAGKYRSKCRIPALTYLHWNNYGSITRSSQPMVGITQNRSIQDEKLVEAGFQSHHSPDSRVNAASVYGSTTTNLIIDARPTTNAMANTAKGAGTENMDHYKDSKKVYLGIDNIHTMRDSLNKVVECLRDADTVLASINNDLSGQITGVSMLDRQALRRSGWLRHLTAIIEGSAIIARNVHVNSSHVLIHCSDGWDRTSQLSALSQLLLDPFYRTIRGFEILVEKDWVSFGHKFLDRSGHLSSDKFFVNAPDPAKEGEGQGAAQAIFAYAQNKFASQNHVKETSPVFHQFLECVRNLQRQYPQRFQFNERFLRQLYRHLYSCQFGTFLFDTERERRVGDGLGPPPAERTFSVWDYMNSPEEMALNTNSDYDPSLDAPTKKPPGDMGVLMPNTKDVRFWNELYGRTDEEMNGRIAASQIPAPEIIGPVESSEDDPIARAATPASVPLPPSPAKGPLDGLAPSRANTLTPTMRRAVSPTPSTAIAPPPERPQSYSQDSFRPFSEGGSAFSMKPSHASSQPQSGNGRSSAAGPAGGDFVRSMWGRLSSNASAAFSAVQEAYVGAPTDRPPDGTQQAGELRGVDEQNVWADPQPEASSSRLGAAGPGPTRRSSNNPWALPESSSVVSPSPYENPWGSTPAAKERQLDVDIFPADPMVSPVLLKSASPAPPERSTSRTTMKEKVQDPNPSLKGTDPLGVGPL